MKVGHYYFDHTYYSRGKKANPDPPDRAAQHVQYILRPSAEPSVVSRGISKNYFAAKTDVERLTENIRKNGRMADVFRVSLPRQLSPDQRVEAVKEFAYTVTMGSVNSRKKGLSWDKVNFIAVIHQHDHVDKNGKFHGDTNNPHFHMMLFDKGIETSMRVVKTTDLNSTDRLRPIWTRVCNKHLELANSDYRIDHRTLDKQLESAIEEEDFERISILEERIAENTPVDVPVDEDLEHLNDNEEEFIFPHSIIDTWRALNEHVDAHNVEDNVAEFIPPTDMLFSDIHIDPEVYPDMANDPIDDLKRVRDDALALAKKAQDSLDSVEYVPAGSPISERTTSQKVSYLISLINEGRTVGDIIDKVEQLRDLAPQKDNVFNEADATYRGALNKKTSARKEHTEAMEALERHRDPETHILKGWGIGFFGKTLYESPERRTARVFEAHAISTEEKAEANAEYAERARVTRDNAKQQADETSHALSSYEHALEVYGTLDEAKDARDLFIAQADFAALDISIDEVEEAVRNGELEENLAESYFMYRQEMREQEVDDSVDI